MFQVKNLSFRYPKNQEDTLRQLSFSMARGEVFGLLGPSGVGKSTTQKVMTKLLPRYQGEIQYRDQNLQEYGRDFYQEIGVGFEMPVHFSRLTARENLAFFKKLYRENADSEALLKRLGLQQDADRKVGEYSKGMKVRLNFVRALLNNPRVLFLDEPTMGLDPQNSRIIKQMIKEFREQGGTVLLSTHLMNDVEELCDRVAFLASGKIAEIDTPKNLKLKYGERTLEVEYAANDRIQSASFNLDTFGHDPEFLNIIQNQTVITIHSRETSLDDIFIKITGVETHE